MNDILNRFKYDDKAMIQDMTSNYITLDAIKN